ncbi:PAS domain-containing protein [Streptomyces cacaoi]
MAGAEEFASELVDFRRRVEELKSARALPGAEPLATLDAALFELQHAADVLWPRYEELMAAGHHANHADSREPQLLRALFQRLPVPVTLLDKDAVVRRMNAAAGELFAVGAGYASGRALTGSLAHGDRAAFRSQVAAVSRGEGARSLQVHLPHPPHEEAGAPRAAGCPADTADSTRLRVTLSALHPPGEKRSAVLAVFQPVVHAMPPTVPPPPPPEPARTVRHIELLDLVDDMAAELLVAGDPQEALDRAAGVLRGRFADWVVLDLADGADAPGGEAVPETPRVPDTADLADGSGDRPRLRRALTAGPAGAEPEREALGRQDPASAPLVTEAFEGLAQRLLVRPEDPDALGADATGSPVLTRLAARSVLCVPLTVPPEDGAPGAGGAVGTAVGVLTLVRTGGREDFALAEAGAADRMARHLALALTGPRAHAPG